MRECPTCGKRWSRCECPCECEGCNAVLRVCDIEEADSGALLCEGCMDVEDAFLSSVPLCEADDYGN